MCFSFIIMMIMIFYVTMTFPPSLVGIKYEVIVYGVYKKRQRSGGK